MDAAALIVVIYLSQKNMNSILDDGIKKGRWLRGINCPCCTDVIPLEYMEKLQTTADEERFHKMMEEYPDGFAQ